MGRDNQFISSLIVLLFLCKPVEASFVPQNVIIGGFILFSISMVCIHCYLKMQEREKYDARVDNDIPIDTSVLTIDNLYLPGGYHELMVDCYEEPSVLFEAPLES